MSLAMRLVHNAFAAFGLRVTRVRPPNRFDAMCDSLPMIARAGFEPTVVIDAGSNMGQWARKASDAFPGVPLRLIEPQSACQAELRAFASTRGSVEIHQTAVTRPGRALVRMAGATAGSTGAHVLRDGERAENESSLAATTLDSLFGDRVGHSDRVLLKLDLERGFEFYDVAALASRRRDGRLRTGDVIFVRSGSALPGDNRWA